MKLVVRPTLWTLCSYCLKVWIHLAAQRVFNFSVNRDNTSQLLKRWFRSCTCCCLMKWLLCWILKVNTLCKKCWMKWHWVEQWLLSHISSALFSMWMSFSLWRMTRSQKLTHMRSCSGLRTGTTLCAWCSLWIRHDDQISCLNIRSCMYTYEAQYSR